MLRELKRIQAEELDGRRSLEEQGALDPSKQGLELPKFGLGLIDQDTEEYDERVRQVLEAFVVEGSGVYGRGPRVFLDGLVKKLPPSDLSMSSQVVFSRSLFRAAWVNGPVRCRGGGGLNYRSTVDSLCLIGCGV